MKKPGQLDRKRTRVALATALMLAALALGACAGSTPEPAAQPAAATVSPAPAGDASPTSVPSPISAEPTPAPAEPTPLATPEPVREQNAAAADPAELAALGARVEEAMDAFAAERQFSGAVLVARNGGVAFAKGYGDADRAAGIANDTQTRFLIGSITKPITSIILLMLQERGLLDVSDPVCDYVDPCPESWADITIGQTLAHTAGIPNFTEAPDFRATQHLPSTVTETIDRFRNRPLDFAPGEHWHYSDSGYIVLGHIIETVTGKPYAEAAQELVFAPLGMANTGYSFDPQNLAVGYVDASGTQAEYIDMTIPHAAGGLYSTAEDLLKLDRALAENTLLSPALQEAMFTPQAAIPDDPNTGYGYGWVMMERFGRPIAFHNGGIDGYMASMTRVLRDDVLIVVLSNEERTVPRPVQETLLRAIYSD